MFVGGGPEAELDGGGDVGLPVGCQERNLPAFVLHIGRDAKSTACEDVRIHRNVILCSAFGDVAWI